MSHMLPPTAGNNMRRHNINEHRAGRRGKKTKSLFASSASSIDRARKQAKQAAIIGTQAVCWKHEAEELDDRIRWHMHRRPARRSQTPVSSPLGVWQRGAGAMRQYYLQAHEAG